MKQLNLIVITVNIITIITAAHLNFESLNFIKENFYINDATLSPTTAPPSRHISPAIIKDLSDFVDLIPKEVIALIIAKHVVIDPGFRDAMEFLESKHFTKMLDDLVEVPEIVELLDYLQILEPKSEAKEMDLSVPYLEIVLLEALTETQAQQQKRNRRSTHELPTAIATVGSLKTFISVVNEVLKYLPRDKYTNLIKEKCEKSAQFETFYKALRSQEFRPKVEVALVSTNLVPFVKTLNSNKIDVHGLVPIAFQVISWGPVIN